MSLRTLSTRAQSALVIFGLILVVALAYLLLISPRRSAASDVDDQLAQVQAQIDERRVQSSGGAPGQVDVLQLFRLTRAMPDEPNVSDVILELNRVAAQSGLRLESIAPGGLVSGSGYQVLPIAVTFDGSFRDVSQFLGRVRGLVQLRKGTLKATGRLFAVESVSLAESEQLFPKLRASLAVNAFVYGGGEAPASGGTTTSTTPTPAAPPPSQPAGAGAGAP